ncbi:MAG: hypothetical protein JWO59_900 [Chloroflexi bacterium]|nr:hypothetical protein [Chloroflexota bacterium]
MFALAVGAQEAALMKRCSQVACWYWASRPHDDTKHGDEMTLYRLYRY